MWGTDSGERVRATGMEMRAETTEGPVDNGGEDEVCFGQKRGRRTGKERNKIRGSNAGLKIFSFHGMAL